MLNTKFIPLLLFTLKLSKLSKLLKMSKLSKFSQINAKHVTSTNLLIFFMFSSLMTIVPVVIWAEACPFASSSTESLFHHRTKTVYVYTHLTNRVGGRTKGVIGGKMVSWGNATCHCPRTCVSRPCSSLCMVTCVLALRVMCQCPVCLYNSAEAECYALLPCS